MKTAVDKKALEPPAQWICARVGSDFIPMRIGNELEAFLVEAIGDSYSLQAMAMRVRRAEALHRIAAGSRYPSLSFTFEGEKSEMREGRAGRVENRSYQPVGGFSWELDIWGKFADRAAGAEMEYEATFMDWHSARLSLCTRLAKGWYQAITAGMLVRQSEDIAESYARTLKAVEERYQTGLADSLELYMARTAHSQALEQLSVSRVNATLAVQELQVLAGQYPDGKLQLPKVLPELVAVHPEEGIPSQLAMNRPDLMALQNRVEAADREWSAALKDMLPTITLSARTGTKTSFIGDSFDPQFGFWQLVAGVSQPLFEGGRLRSRAEEVEYTVNQLQLEYCEKLLNAFREVEATLSLEQSLHKQYRQAGETLEHATSSWDAALEQYRFGTTDLLTVLVNQRQYLQSRLELIRLQNAGLQNAMDLIASLGSGDCFSAVFAEQNFVLSREK